MLFGCSRENINHSPENLKVIYTQLFVFYARINYHFKTKELKNVEKLVDQTVQASKSCQLGLVFCMNPGCIINALTAFPIAFREEVLFSPWCPSGCHMISQPQYWTYWLSCVALISCFSRLGTSIYFVPCQFTTDETLASFLFTERLKLQRQFIPKWEGNNTNKGSY